MSKSSVCAIVVTCNHKDRLRGCLNSLLAQTRPADRIVVIDNASTDGTRAMLDAEYPQVSKITLKEYAGGAGGLVAGMRFAHCNKFDWIWTLDDSLEVTPECLETMLSFESEGDLIQVQAGIAGGRQLHTVDENGNLRFPRRAHREEDYRPRGAARRTLFRRGL